MKLILLGAPGVGKGTQARRIKDEYNITQISTGDIFRSNIEGNTKLGQKAKEYMDKGQLVPDELTIDLVIDRISNDDCNNGYILDGFPRTISQAEALDKYLKSSNDKIDLVIDIEVPAEEIIERMSERRVCPNCGATYHMEHNPPKEGEICDVCGTELVQRNDDKIETVSKRLRVYHEQTQPLIEYYKNKNVLVDIDGLRQIDIVYEDIISNIEKRR